MTGRGSDGSSTLKIEWSIARAEAASDPFAFQPGRQTYLRHLEDGQVRAAELDWDDVLLGDLNALASRGPDDEAAARARATLQRFVGALGVEGDLQRLVEEHAAGRPARIVLRLAAAELHALPWEALPVGARGEALSLIPGVSVQYAWPGLAPRAPELTPRPAGGRILLAWSEAGGPVPHARHVEALRAASGDGRHAFKDLPVALGGDVLAEASRAGIAAALEQARQAGRPFVALHLLAHGRELEGSAACGVVLDGAGGEEDRVGPEALRALLAPHAAGLHLVVLCVCRAGDGASLGSRLGSLAQILHREGVGAVVASRALMSMPCADRLVVVLYHRLLRERDALEAALGAARRAIVEQLDPREALGLQLYAVPDRAQDIRVFVIPPYRGLMAFKPHHEAFFRGREPERDELLREVLTLVERPDPTVMFVVGASGAGKSSLVMAGLIPALSRLPGRPWSWSAFKPGDAPLARLEAALASRGGATRHLIVIDQFEELFTHVEAPQERERFVQRLWALAEDDAQDVHFVLVIRVDYLGRCGEIALTDGRRLDRIAYAPEHHVFVPEMDPKNLRRVIEEPIQLVGITLQPGLAETILAEVGSAPGGLPALEFTLEQTWKARRGGQLTLEAYRQVGGVAGALTGLAERLWERLSAGGADPDLPTARMFRRILVGLVGFQREAPLDTRRRVALSDLRPVEGDPEADAAFSEVLGLLETQRLIILDRREQGVPTVEVAHEALIRSWSRLREWVDFDRIKLDQLAWLRRAVQDWEEFGDARLLREDELRHAQRLVARWEDDVTDRQRALLEASLAAESAQRATWERELREGRDLERLQVAAERAGDPTVAAALLLDVEAPDQLRGWRQAVADVLRRPIASHALELPDVPLQVAAFHPGGERVALGTRGGGVWLWSGAADPLKLAAGGAPVLQLAFVQQGSALVAVDGAGVIRSWSLATVEREPALWATARATEWAAVDPQGAWALLGAPDGGLTLFDLRAGAPCWTRPSPGAALTGLAFSGSGQRAVAIFADGAGLALGPVSREERPLVVPGERLQRAVAATTGELVAGAWSGRVYRWGPDLDGPSLLFDAGSPVACLALSQSARAVAATTYGTLRLWRAPLDGGEAVDLCETGRTVTRLTWRPDGRALALGRVDGSALIMDAVSGELSQELAPQGGDLVEIAFDRDRARVLTAAAGGSVRVWSGVPATSDTLLRGHTGPLSSASFAPDGRAVLTCSADGTARLWTLDGRTPPRVLVESERWRPSFAFFSPDGRRVLAASRDGGALLVWEQPGDQPPRVHQVLSGDLKDLCVLDAGGVVAAACDDGVVRVVELDGAAPPRELRGHEQLVRTLAWDGARGRLLSGSWDHSARLWSPRGAEGSTALRGHTGPVLAVALSPDGRWAATGSADGTARLWRLDAAGVSCAAVLEGHMGRVLGVAFHPYEPRLLTASVDAAAAIWSFDQSSGAIGEVAWLRGHLAEVLLASFSPVDGAQVLTVSTDGTARVWSRGAAGAWEGITLQGHRGALRWGEYSPDGAQVVTASMDGTARVWDVRYGDLPGRLSEATRYRLSPEARARLLGG